MIPDPVIRPVMSADEVFQELGIDRTTGYRAIKDGTFPIEVIRVGRIIRVPTIAVCRLLGIEPTPRTPDHGALPSGEAPGEFEHRDPALQDGGSGPPSRSGQAQAPVR